MSESVKKPQNEHTFLNIVCNIVLPIFILNKGHQFLTPLYSLLIALAFPLGYGLFELAKKRKFNMFSLLGLLNVGFTGGLALSGLGGIWFAIKDAAFPGLIGLFVFGSAFSKSPFIQTLFLNPSVIKIELLEEKLHENSSQEKFRLHIKKATFLLSLSFLFSAILNFILAQRIFLPINEALPSDQRSILLNEQIAKMTSTSLFVIMVPSIIFMLGLFWYLFRGIHKLTGLKTEEIIHQ